MLTRHLRNSLEKVGSSRSLMRFYKNSNQAIAEMYVKGISTRRVGDVLEQMCGLEVSSTQVSRVSKILDEQLEKWRDRLLGAYPYLVLDAHYEKGA